MPPPIERPSHLIGAAALEITPAAASPGEGDELLILAQDAAVAIEKVEAVRKSCAVAGQAEAKPERSWLALLSRKLATWPLSSLQAP